ncbi:MAG TPA: hypothetical protein VJA94_01570 [Candidatus Angelobacter sp.]
MTRVLSVDLLDHHNQALMHAGFLVSPCALLALAVKLLDRIPQPDVLLIGHSLSRKRRKRLVQRVMKASPKTHVIVLSGGRVNGKITPDGIVPADVSPAELVAAVLNVTNLAMEAVSRQAVADCKTYEYAPVEIDQRSVKVLYVAANEGVARLRTIQLKRAGYCAVGAVTLQQIELAWDKDCFDLVVVSPAIGPRLKAMIATIARQRSPRVRLLEIGTARPEIEGAYLLTADSGEELVTAIRQIISQRRSRNEQCELPPTHSREVRAP